MQGQAIVILLGGWALVLLFVWMSVRASRMRRYLDDTPTSQAQGVFVGDVELKGTAESDGPICAYLSEIACVYNAWSIEEQWQRWVTETYRDEKGNTRTRQRLEAGSTTVASGGSQIPFYLKDDTGVVLIWPEGAKIESQQVVRFECGPDHPAYYGKGPNRAVAGSTHVRTFYEQAIPLHAQLFIAGRARERQDMVAPEIAADGDARLFLISVRDEKAVGGGYKVASWLWAVFGFAIAMLTIAIAESSSRSGSDPNVLWYLAGIAGYLGLTAFSWGWMAFNSIVTLRQRVRRAWANIEVELKRRADLIPNLAAVVKAARMHDKDTQQVLAVLRAQASIAPAEARGRSTRVQGVTRVMTAIAEAYPAISAQPNFLALQKELANTEARIALARSYYNGIAVAFNARLLVVPDRFLALLAGLRPFELFNATDLEREVPQVDFVQS